jgi:hypothetical protein
MAKNITARTERVIRNWNCNVGLVLLSALLVLMYVKTSSHNPYSLAE